MNQIRPLAIDLFCGLGGWAEGFLSEGWDVIGFDVERHDYGTGGYPGQLVLQDVTTLHGSQFRNADVIVASPPCQAYSYRAMPWKRAKALGPPDNTLFETCFRLQREASEAAGRYIPLIVENVRGAEKWVGPAGWHFGSYYLWGDIPALMVYTDIAHHKIQSPHLWLRDPKRAGRKFVAKSNGVKSVHGLTRGPLVLQDVTTLHGSQFRNADVIVASPPCQAYSVEANKERGAKTPTGNCSAIQWKDRPIARYAHPTPQEMERQGFKVPGLNFSKPGSPGFNVTAAQRYREEQGVKQNGSGPEWFDNGIAKHSSRSDSRKAASAQIAKIPLPLAQHIARVFKPFHVEHPVSGL